MNPYTYVKKLYLKMVNNLTFYSNKIKQIIHNSINKFIQIC